MALTEEIGVTAMRAAPYRANEARENFMVMNGLGIFLLPRCSRREKGKQGEDPLVSKKTFCVDKSEIYDQSFLEFRDISFNILVAAPTFVCPIIKPASPA